MNKLSDEVFRKVMQAAINSHSFFVMLNAVTELHTEHHADDEFYYVDEKDDPDDTRTYVPFSKVCLYEAHGSAYITNIGAITFKPVDFNASVHFSQVKRMLKQRNEL